MTKKETETVSLENLDDYCNRHNVKIVRVQWVNGQAHAWVERDDRQSEDTTASHSP